MTWEEIYSQLPEEKKQIVDLAIDYGLTDGLDKLLKEESAKIIEQEEQRNEEKI